MSMPLISIIVCTYNRDRFLPECLHSVAAQTVEGAIFELLIIDNNSNDNTASISKDFISQNPELNAKYILEPKQGLSNARNRGIVEAGGEYLAFVDDDAILDADYLKNLHQFISIRPDVTGLGGKIIARYVDGEEPDWMNPYSRGLFLSEVDYGNEIIELDGYRKYPFGCNMIIHRRFFDTGWRFDSTLGVIGKDGGRCEEKVLFRDIARKKDLIYYLPDAFVHHQIDVQRMTKPYIRKLSWGLGTSLRVLSAQEGFGSFVKRGFEIIIKFFGAIFFSIVYLLKGKASVSKHLIEYRWLVLKGYFKGQ